MLRKLWNQASFRYSLLSALIWGLAAHAYAFFHDFFSHDALNAMVATPVEEHWKIELGRFLFPLYRTIIRNSLALPWIIGLFTILWAALYYGVFAVRNIQIIGNSQVPDGEMIRLSGIRIGMPLFSVNTQEVERKLEQNPVLKFRYMEKKLPDTLIISVREREACCWMTWNGIMYTMDKQRAVLFETEDMTIQPSELVRVSGLEIRAGAMTGQTLVLDSAEQQMVFTNLFLEMKVLGCTKLIKEADLSNLNSLLLTTRDGFTVALGDSSNIHAKLRAMLLTREELLKRNYQGGVINVTLPETPIFSPAIG